MIMNRRIFVTAKYDRRRTRLWKPVMPTWFLLAVSDRRGVNVISVRKTCVRLVRDPKAVVIWKLTRRGGLGCPACQPVISCIFCTG